MKENETIANREAIIGKLVAWSSRLEERAGILKPPTEEHVHLPADAEAKFTAMLNAETDADVLWLLSCGLENHATALLLETKYLFPEWIPKWERLSLHRRPSAAPNKQVVGSF